MNVRDTRKLKEFFDKYRFEHFEKNQTLIYAGDDPPGVFFLLSGQVRQYDITERGEEVVVNVFTPPAFFPIAWAISRTPNQYFYETATSTDVKLASAKDVAAFLKTNPGITYNLLIDTYDEINTLERRMAHLMGGSARSRVLFELIVEGQRFGVAAADGSLTLLLHETELARRSGLSRETINRELAKLKRKKIINVTHKEIIIKNIKQLKKELGVRL